MLLLLLWLEGANGTSLALVVCGIEDLTGHTDWNSAGNLKGGAQPDNSDSRGADPGSCMCPRGKSRTLR